MQASEDAILTAVNRFFDATTVIINAMISLVLLSAPWYRLTADETFEGCTLTKGTVLAPFSSGLCTYDSFFDLPQGGDHWARMFMWVWVYTALSLFVLGLLTFKAATNTFGQWDNANTISFVLNFAVLVILSIILGNADVVAKPENVDNATSKTAIIVALVLTVLRLPLLAYHMYIIKERGNARGYFGTGARVSY